MAEASLFGDQEVGGPPTLTVGELAARIARLTASAFPGDLWVEGQIRNLSRSANGHAYFDLAEPTAAGEQPRAQVSVTLLAPERKHVNEQLKRAGGAVRMDDGIEVRIQGRLRWYAPRGTLQLRMSGIDPAFTLGRLQADRDRILAALAADGLVEANGRLPVPLVPLRVGLVTSVGSAAHADVLSELTGSGLAFVVRTADARTQGPDAARSVVHALHRVARDGVDVILLVRGGGARTDLAGFDTDLVARAIAAMPVPVFTGIGHEVDRSIADELAHSAHKTPTAAAAAVVSLVRAFLDRVDERWSQARRAAAASAAVADARLDRRAARVGRAATRTLARHTDRLDGAANRTGRGAGRVLDRADHVLDASLAAATGRAERGLARADRALDALAAQVRAHDPQLALARGWTITTTADGRPVGRLQDLTAGTELVTRFVDGTATSTITTVDAAPPPPPTRSAP
ncbi:exodeoxyribonuclease VII large subunit [Aquihabitans sp. G128]|uniref:exodeoxyribonuclease VII large subunit n=1 Tax=Aquihabitans sp. G128 TaxID=2849779 RepID=UPI001C2481ED|nr:exodeoxyribonuclease VII large subunit [Aquihabitans sp. G128]QXC59550.1 exodeoxyribonuclease VII large subunit [Aquihabitans sp. G128]